MQESKQFRSEMTDQISGAMVELYAANYGHQRTIAQTYINDKSVLCLLQNSESRGEEREVTAGGAQQVTDNRVAFQVRTEDEFTQAIERITGRSVVAFMSANQDSLDYAAELFILDEAPATAGAQ